MLSYHADVLETIERAGEFGINASVDGVAFAEIVREVNEEVTESAESIRQGLESSSRHDRYQTEGHFVDDRTIKMSTGEQLSADTVVVAAGTRPRIPPIDGIEDVDYLTSREALQLGELPDHLIIVGGGYIAAELGHFFETFGSEVSIIGRRPHLLPDADREVATEFTERLADRVDVYTGYEGTSVSQSDGSITVDAGAFSQSDSQSSAESNTDEDEREGESEDESDQITVTGDELLVAAGRVPNTDIMNVSAAGIKTDDYLRTTAEDVWALGDIVGEYLLKHNANHEARAVTRNLFDDELQPVDYTGMPFAVFSSPEVAGVDATEQELRAGDREYATGTYRYENMARRKAIHAEGMVKVYIDLEGKILGCHIVGPEASTLIEEVLVAMKAGSETVRDIRKSVHVHPALSEVVQRAFTGPFSQG